MLSDLKKKGPGGIPVGVWAGIVAVAIYLGYQWFKNRGSSSSTSSTDTTGAGTSGMPTYYQPQTIPTPIVNVKVAAPATKTTNKKKKKKVHHKAVTPTDQVQRALRKVAPHATSLNRTPQKTKAKTHRRKPQPRARQIAHNHAGDVPPLTALKDRRLVA